MRAAVAAALPGLLAQGPLAVRIAGGCMAPALAEAGLIRLTPVRRVWPGDVVAFRTAAGVLTAHRVLLALPGRLYTQADRAQRPDDAVPRELLVGRLDVAVACGDRARALLALGCLLLRGLRRRLE